MTKQERAVIKLWDAAKFGIFHVSTDTYRFPEGWVQKEEKAKIIGETNELFVTRLLQSEQDEWVGNQVIHKNHIIPLGYHKSRLVKWTSGQLTLF